jgi:UDP-N-acetylmuramate--alanine ligase
MAPLAHYLKSLGLPITGSDSSKEVHSNSDFSDFPLALDGDLSLCEGAGCVVYSSAIPQTDPEFLRSKELKKKLFHRSELLALVCEPFKTIAVAGTHGKSTTAALIVHVLRQCGLDPSSVTGAKLLASAPTGFGGAWSFGASEYMVIEADESDGSFLRYSPWLAVLTNIDEDHLDFYADMSAVEDAFLAFLNKVHAEGTCAVFWDHERVRSVASRELKAPRLTFGSFLGSEVRLLKFSPRASYSELEVIVDHDIHRFSLPLIGKHNAFNALAALCVCKALGVNLEDAKKAFASFPGVSRRLELHFKSPSTLVYDDYAHNPMKISSCIGGLREAFPSSRITVIFQPHRYSRLTHMFKEMLGAFSRANLVVVLPVYAAGESLPNRVPGDYGVTPAEFFSPRFISQKLTQFSGVASTSCNSLKEAKELLQSNKQIEHSIFVTIGAGDVWTVARDFATHLRG